PHVNHCTAGKTSVKQDQGPVGVDGESFGELLEVHSLRVLPSYANGDLHQHALTAAPGACMRGRIRNLSHAIFLQINYTRKDRIVENIPEGGIQKRTVIPTRADRSERNGGCRIPGRSGEGARFSARGRGASLPT